MDPERMMLACGTTSEERAARRAGVHVERVGLNAARGVPAGRVVSFGLAGALSDDLACGDVLDATRIVDETGRTLWEDEPLGVGRPATILAGERIIDDPVERRRLHEATGADAVDLESGPLARAGRLVGCVRVVGDTPARPLGRLCAARPDGTIDARVVVWAFLHEPRASARAAGDARRALRVLRRTAEAFA